MVPKIFILLPPENENTMLIYRFRVTANDHDDFLREVEILPNQTFLDFHHLLVETAEMKHISGASFYTTDKKNKVRHQITLKNTKKQVRRFDDDMGEVVIENITLPLMKDARIKNYIDDPHQTMNYEFLGKEVIIMHIELFKILQSESMVSYPRVSRKSGELRKIVEITALHITPEAGESPTVVKPSKAKPVIIVKPSEIPKLDTIEEDIEEIKAIEEEIADILEEEAPETFEIESQVATTEDGDDAGFSEDEHMEHIEDFGDIDQIDERYSNYREGSDDY